MKQDYNRAPVERGVRIKHVTIVYEVVNHEEWVNSNPLWYEHNGLKAIGVSRGDLMQRVENLECVCNENDIAIPEIMPPNAELTGRGPETKQ